LTCRLVNHDPGAGTAKRRAASAAEASCLSPELAPFAVQAVGQAFQPDMEPNFPHVRLESLTYFCAGVIIAAGTVARDKRLP
jgi:hypothetical protein